ncbi:Flagellar M-ring protein [Buchnera aphidicola (Eriosoma lanigerum)]|uniref:flagellar basal-body MS-ring/collar protein FliF n=1 Tax=Buchnera aphidicola TaxID=9 RepID=UPI0034640766
MNFTKINQSHENKSSVHGVISQFLNQYKFIFICFFVFLCILISSFLWKQSDSYRVLYNNLSNLDGGAIITQLKQMNVPYRFTKDSGLLLVPENKIYETRFKLAEQGLPKGSGVGFELLDRDKLGSSQFLEQVNYQRALEGELSRSILKINVIRDARVHLALPKESLFLDEKKQPSASIIVNLYPGKILNERQIEAIVHLVSSSISGLSENHVSIIDELGNLLTHTNNSYNSLNSSQLNYTKLIETYYSSRIEKILTPLVGEGNVHAAVTAKMNFNVETRSEDKYLPNFFDKDQSIRSKQTMSHIQLETDNKKQSHQIISNFDHDQIQDSDNLINTKKNTSVKKMIPEQKSSLIQQIPTDSNNQQENTINYELDHVLSHIQVHTGDIQHLSAAVIINYVKNQKGELIPLNNKSLNQIKHLVQKIIGYSKNRKDSIEVVNAAFVQRTPSAPIHKIITIKRVQSNQDILKLLFSIIVILLFIIICYQYKIRKYKRNKINLLSQQNTSLQKETIKSNVKANIDESFEEKNNNLKQSNFNQNINNSITKKNNDPKITALTIQKWINGE